MSDQTISVRRVDDAALHDLFTKACDEATAAIDDMAENSAIVSAKTGFHGPACIGSIDTSEQQPQAGSYNISTAVLVLYAKATSPHAAQPQIRFTYRRGGVGEYDALTIPEIPSNNGEVWTTEAGKKVISHAYQIISRVLAPLDSKPDTHAGALANFAANIDASFRNFTSGVEETLAGISRERQEHRTEIQKERADLLAEIETQRAEKVIEAQAEFERRSAELNDREKELDAREASIDIKSYRDSRRRQFAELQEQMHTSIMKPVSNRGMITHRLLVFLGLVFMSAGAGFMTYETTNILSSLPEQAALAWVVVAKSIGFSVVSLGSLAGAVQWLRHFYTKDLQSVEEMRRFRNDMARASWAIETALEIRKEHGEEIPERWLENVTDGLFQGEKGSGADDEGGRALAALLGMSASAEFGPNGAKIGVGKKGLREMSKAACQSKTEA